MTPPEQTDAASMRPRETAEVVCVGMITPATVLVVDELPAWNIGACWSRRAEFISDDAAIVAMLLTKWGLSAGLIGTALGNDEAGRSTARRLREYGILGDFRVCDGVETPYEVNISDATGARTYLWRREPEVLATLETADLSMIAGTKLIYADWYDGDHVLPALREANRLGVPVMFNIEHGHQDSEILRRYAPYVTVCQAVTDAAQQRTEGGDVASRLLASGVQTALVTLAERGCLAATSDGGTVAVHAPRVDVVDGCAAGATFSAGFIYGTIRSWSLEERLRYAVAAASLQCTRVGPTAFPPGEILSLAGTLQVELGGLP